MLRLANDVRAEITVKRSKFISVMTDCSDGDVLKRKKDALRLEHPKASHIVHAAIFSSPDLFSFSDDREPKGCAGAPTLGVLRGCDAICVAIFTIRYFGGTLLGVGGLKRAYFDSAKACASAAKFKDVRETGRLEFAVGYRHAGKIEDMLRRRGIEITSVCHGDDVRFSIVTERERIEGVKSLIEGVLGGGVKFPESF